MPEIKHNFIKGRMNKDLDERLVPNGEYRDALNIEVSTSEGSDVGSVQNLEGNLLVSSKDQNNNDFLSDDTDSTGINRNASSVGSYADQSTKTIFNFIHKASDLVEDGTYGGRVRFTGVRSDVISTYKPTSTNSGITYPLVTDVYETRIAPTVLQTGQSGIIEGVPGIAYRTVNGVTLYAPKGVVPGMKVKLLGPDGFNYWFNQTVVVKSIQLGYSESDTKIITTIPQSGSLYFDAVNRDAGLVFQFTSDRILNFQEGVKEIESNAEGTPSSITPKDTIITGINYVNDILFYTDNLTEPKRIVLDRFLNTDGSYDVHSNVQRHSLWRSTIEESDQENFVWLEEKYITTIRKNPRLAPTVVAKASDRPAGANIGNTSLSYSDATFSSIAITDGGFNSTFNFLLPNQSAVVESGQEYDVSAVLKTVNWRVGDVLVLTGNLSAATARVKIVVADTSQSTTVGNFTISLLDIDEGYFVAGEVVPPQESWQAVLSSNKKIHNTSFVYFAYRYKYFDGEYSAISPYSKPVFIPSFYSFNSITGFNVGMENQLRSMQVSDFVEKSIPADVAEIEILFRTSDSENLYAIETVKKDSTKWSESLSGGCNTGLIKIEDAVFGRTIESKQLVRSFDAVPTKAKAQEFSSSRLMYGNYTEGYDLINSDGQRVEADITSTLVNRDVSFTTSIPFLNIVDASYNNPGIFEFSHNSEESSETGDLSLVSLPTNNEFIDTTNAFNTAEALYTCNVAGEYSIDLLLESKVITGNYSGTNASSQNTLHELQLGVFKNGSIVGGFSEQSFSLSNNASFHSSEFSISKSQTISLAVGDEVNFRIKGSFLSLSQLITDFSLDIQNFVLNINGGETAVDVTTSAPRESVKSIRDYQVGVVYGDKYGRESEIIFDTEDTINATQQDSITANNIKCSIKNKFPYWAEYYKFFVKEIAAEYYNISLFKAYPNDGTLSDPDVSTVYYWLSFNSADRNKVEKDDYLLLKKKHGVNQAPLLADGTVEADARWRVLDIVDKAETADDGFEIKGVPITATDQDISGKFFVKIEADLNFDDYIGFDFSDSNVLNGAVFEVEKKQTQTLDLFYEASQAYPIRLDKVNAESYIKHGSKVAPIVGGDLNDLVNGGFKVVNVKGAEAIQGNYAYFNSNSSEDYFCIVTIANEAGQNVQDYFLELGLDFIQTNTVFSSGSYIRFEQEDGSYVTAQAVSMNTVDNTIKIIPYTHSTQQGFIGSNISVGETDICLPWYNCFAFGNGVESDRIRDDFNSKTIFPYTSVGKQSGFKASLPVVNYNKRENTSDIIFSQIFNESTQVAGYNEFIVAEDITKKLNSEYGSIQRLYTRQSNVLAFCENKVLKILADKDALFNADGEILRVSSTNVLGEAVPFSGDHGISNNPESLAVDEYRIYFTDKFRGSVCRLSQDGVTAISNIGMRDWFNDNLEPASAMIGSYDTNKNEYNLTIHSSTNPGYKKEVYTLTYSDSSIDGQRGGWVSFKSFIKEGGLSMSNEYYTFKNGDMWLHHPEQESVLQNNFYGTQYTSTLDVLFNDFSGDVKLFKTLNYEGTQSKEI